MPTNLNKVQKKIIKKKGRATALHGNSRDAQKLRRAGNRAEKLEKLSAARVKANQPLRKCPEHGESTYALLTLSLQQQYSVCRSFRVQQKQLQSLSLLRKVKN